MGLRYLFGPVSAAFSAQNLNGPRQKGDCLAFNADGDADIKITSADSWQDVQARFPQGWRPDFVALNLAYTTLAQCLGQAPVPKVGLAGDWNLLWHYYRQRLGSCELIFTDTLGAEVLQREGLGQARAGLLCGCEQVFIDASWPEQRRDIDVLFLGNLNPAVQRERAPWIRRLAWLGRRYQVVIRSGVIGESYRRLLGRARIVFHHSAKGKCGRRAFEAAAAGALVFQEMGNRELTALFRDREHCVYYAEDNLEQLLEHYLDHEEERKALTDAAKLKVAQLRFEDLWSRLVDGMEQDCSWREPRGRSAGNGLMSSSACDAENLTAGLLTRCWQALGSAHFDDRNLLGEIEKALADRQQDAALANALGVLALRQHEGRSTARIAAEVAAEHFRTAISARPDFALATLNLAESLRLAGQDLASVEAARRALDLLQQHADLDPESTRGLPVCHGYDDFRVEWERAGWANVGNPGAEKTVKKRLLRWKAFGLLATWIDELSYFYEAALARPDLARTRAALGAALYRAGRPQEACPHLEQAIHDNPFDREAPRLLFQALGSLEHREQQRRLVEDRQLLWRAAPGVAPVEAWFAPPRPADSDLVSIIVLACNQKEYTQRCLESLLRHTRAPYELVLVDNGSDDGTLEYFQGVKNAAGPEHVEVIRNETNRGFPAGCNQGIERSRGRYLVFLNNDTVLTPAWLEKLIAACLRQWPVVGLVGPVTNNAPDAQRVAPDYRSLDDLDMFAQEWSKSHAEKMLAVRRLTGFCLLTRRDLIERIGVFDERFGLGFFDDDDFCVRAREAGFRLVIAQDVFIHHFGNRTFRGIGVDTRQELLGKFEKFRDKWGSEYTAGYELPPLLAETAAAPAAKANGEAASPAIEENEGASLSPVEAPLVPLAAESSMPAAEGAEPGPAAGPAGADEPKFRLEMRNPERTGVSLAMIVRNEEKHLPDCLRSVEGLFGEIVVVDTGSSDATPQVAQSFGARLFDFPWVDSFAAARNECLRHATGKWIMWLDADDRLDQENREKLGQLLGRLGNELDAYAMKVRSVLDAERTSFRLLDQVRLFRNLGAVRWDYRIHEQILPAVNRAGGGVRWGNVIIDHVGYQDASARRGKLERNLRLLELDHGSRPEDAFSLFNLGWTLLDLGRTEEALGHLKHARERTKPSSSTLRKLYHLLAVAQRSLKRPQEALESCREGLLLFAEDAELLCEEAMLRRDQGDLEGAEKSLNRLLDARRGQYFASEDVGLRGYRTRQLLGEIYRGCGRFSEAEIQWRAALKDRPAFEPAWVGLAELYLRLARWSDLEYLLQKIEKEGASSAKAGWLRARGQFQRSEFAGARSTLERVIAADAKALGPRVLLGQVLLQEGRDWGAAERALRDVLALEPGHRETQHNLTVLLRRIGKAAFVPGGRAAKT